MVSLQPPRLCTVLITSPAPAAAWSGGVPYRYPTRSATTQHTHKLWISATLHPLSLRPKETSVCSPSPKFRNVETPVPLLYHNRSCQQTLFHVDATAATVVKHIKNYSLLIVNSDKNLHNVRNDEIYTTQNKTSRQSWWNINRS